MSWVAVAIGGATIASGLLGSSASKSAANAQAGATQAGIDEQRRQFDITREDMMPWLDTGRSSLSTLADYLGLTVPGNNGPAPTRAQFTTPGATQYKYQSGYMPGMRSVSTSPSTFDQAGYDSALSKYNAPQQQSGNFGSLLKPFTGESLYNEPGYQFGLAEGEKGIDRAMRARGSFDSGSALKALLRFNEDYAGTKYNDAFNRNQAQNSSIYNMLSGVSGTGQTTAAQVGQIGSNSATNIASLLGEQGNARAAGIVGGANAWNNAIGQGLNAYQNYSMMDYLKNN